MRTLAVVALALTACAPNVLKQDPNCSSNVADIEHRLSAPQQAPQVKLDGDWQAGGLRWRILTKRDATIVEAVRQHQDDYGRWQWVVDEQMRGTIDGKLLVLKSTTGPMMGRFEAAGAQLNGALYDECKMVPLTFQQVL